MGESSLTITDNRTGKSYELRIENETIEAMALRQIKADPKEILRSLHSLRMTA